MAGLNHVSMLSNGEWKQITAEEAAKIHCGGIVHAASGLFVCDLCGQKVTLTDGKVKKRYFMHSRGDIDKDCAERATNNSGVSSFQAGSQGMPIRIRIISEVMFEFEIGFIPVPNKILGEESEQKIIISCDGNKTFEYSCARLEQDKITYLSAGSKPSPVYSIRYKKPNVRLKNYWCENFPGIDFNKDGVVFDTSKGEAFPYCTGRMLPNGADIEVSREYYLLTTRKFLINNRHIKMKKLSSMNIGGKTWVIYKVKALSISNESAEFFLNYRCLLTKVPVDIYPIWPVCIVSPYLIYHRHSEMKMFFQGNAESKVFPNTRLKRKENLLTVSCNLRQQLLSVGRMKNVLKYTYFWEDDLNTVCSEPWCRVTDISHNEVMSGGYNKLPEGKILIIETQYDGEAVISIENGVIEKRRLKSENRTEISDLEFGQNIKIYQGLDCCFEISFKKEAKSENDDRLFLKLMQIGGRRIPVSHSIGAIGEYMKNYPKTKSWFYKAVRSGYIPEKALKILKKEFL